MQASHAKIPLALKFAYSTFVAGLVPVYAYHYGPANFFYFCDVALLLTLVGIWLESPLLISMCAVGILAPQVLWLLDFAAHLVGHQITGMTNYMFDSTKSLFLRSLSLFHGWLPILLVWLVVRLGYDRRALKNWTVLAWIVLLISYFVLPGPRPNPGSAAVNINYVHGFSDEAAQTWVHPLLWLAGMMILLPLALLLPTHWALTKWVKPAPAEDGAVKAPVTVPAGAAST
jgi:hypothetical protein